MVAHPDIPDDPAALLRKYHRLICLQFGKYRKLLPPAGDEEGLWQELRIALLRAAREYDPARASFLTAAYTYLSHAALNHVRRELRRGFSGIPRSPGQLQRAAVAASSPAKAIDPDPPPPLEWDAATWAAILDAAGRDRDIVEMRFVQGWKLERIGAAVGITKEGIRQRLIVACRRIRERCAWLADE